MSRYFVNTGDGVEYFDTLAEAETAAQNAIDGWRDCCDPEWPEEDEVEKFTIEASKRYYEDDWRCKRGESGNSVT